MIERISDSAEDDPSLDADDSSDGNGRPQEQQRRRRGQRRRPLGPRRRATAQSMAASQRDISVSEFFAKNRHLLGFDNPAQGPLDHRQGGGRQRPGRLRRGRHPARKSGSTSSASSRTATRWACRTTAPASCGSKSRLIFGKLLYGSKFHRLRMSRGQQGIGISAAGMYGLLTTGKPVKIMSKISKRAAGPLLRNPDRHQAEPAGDPQRPRRRPGNPAQRRAAARPSRSTASSGSRRTTARG